MSPENDARGAKRSQCTGKRRYRDHREANRVRQHQRAVTGGYIRTYDCPFCKGVHFTKQVEK